MSDHLTDGPPPRGIVCLTYSDPELPVYYWSHPVGGIAEWTKEIKKAKEFFLAKNGFAEVDDYMPEGWPHWERVSFLPVAPGGTKELI